MKHGLAPTVRRGPAPPPHRRARHAGVARTDMGRTEDVRAAVIGHGTGAPRRPTASRPLEKFRRNHDRLPSCARTGTGDDLEDGVPSDAGNHDTAVKTAESSWRTTKPESQVCSNTAPPAPRLSTMRPAAHPRPRRPRCR